MGNASPFMKNERLRLFVFALIGLMLAGCAASTSHVPATSKGILQDASKEKAPQVTNKIQARIPKRVYRPRVKWEPTFKVRDVSVKEAASTLPRLKVGADISSQGGPVALKEVLKQLSELKGFNLSWASDVDQNVPAVVDIKSNDDFWQTLTNLLRQYDYFFELKKDTIVIKYKETRRFYIPVPFLTGNYRSDVGGDLLGGEETTQGMVKGTVSLEQSGRRLDIWDTIRTNLDKILNLAVTQAPSVTAQVNPQAKEQSIRESCRRQYPSRPAQQALCVDRKMAEEGLSRIQGGGQGQEQATAATAGSAPRSREGFFYTIDKPLGIITVTAPRSILDQVASYIKALNEELGKQVVIEAKILEVRLSRTHSSGVDWTNLLKDSGFKFNAIFGENGRIYPTKGIKLIGQVNLEDKAFSLLLNALNEYGSVKVLSNPKLTLMNGQPAMLTVGESVRYIDNVESTIDSETGVITYTVNTKSILSGLGFSVMAQITGNDEVVLHITPVTSQLQEPIEYKQFGSGETGSEVGLPRVTLREMTTMAKIKSGQFLIVGGLIDEIKDTSESKIPILGDIPIIGRAFKNTKDYSNKRELIMLLRPQIVRL